MKFAGTTSAPPLSVYPTIRSVVVTPYGLRDGLSPLVFLDARTKGFMVLWILNSQPQESNLNNMLGIFSRSGRGFLKSLPQRRWAP